MTMRVKSYESSQRSNPLPNVDTGPLANDSAAFGGADKTGASIQRFAEAAQGLNESVFDAGLRAQKKAEEDELALKLMEAQQRDKSLWDEQWESIKESAPSVADTSNPPAAAPGETPLSITRRTEKFWDDLAASRMESLGGQHPEAARYIVNNWWGMREKALETAAAYEKEQDLARRNGLFDTELSSAAPVLANPDTPPETRQSLHHMLDRKARAIFSASAPQFGLLEQFKAAQDNAAREARAQRHRETVFTDLSALPPEEAQTRLATPETRRELGLSDAEAADMSGMLRAKSAFDAEREEAGKAAYTARMAEQLAGLFQGPGATGQEASDAGQGTEPAPVAAYRLISGSGLPPHVKDTALARIMDGTFGRQDDLEIKAALVSGLASGALTENAIDEASLSGGLTAAAVSGIREFNKTLQGEDGLLFRGGCEILENSLPPGTPPEQRARAQGFLLHQMTRAAKAGRLAEAIDLKNPDNAVTLSVSLAGMGQGGEPDTLKVLTADHAPLDDTGGYQVANAAAFSTIFMMQQELAQRNKEERKKRLKELRGDPNVRQPQRAGGKVWEAQQQPESGEAGKGEVQKKPREYYVIGRRPLDVDGGYSYNEMESGTFEHRHFIANDGENRGFFQDGPHSDSSEGMGKYEYMDDKKYDAAIIEEAIKNVEKRRAEGQEASKERYNKSLELAEKFSEYEGERLLPRETFEESVDNDYSLIGLNCQSYVNLVIKEAENIAKAKNKSLFVK